MHLHDRWQHDHQWGIFVMRIDRLEHKFVEYIPEKLDSGVLYISVTYATAAHACCCGCGCEVVTPFTPTDWQMAFNGETVSLWPSIGNWNFACRSHYIIDNGKAIDAGPWSDERVNAERMRDKWAKGRYYANLKSDTASAIPTELSTPLPRRIWARIKRVFSRH